MVFALLAGFLLQQRAAVQALVLGLCVGLFVAALAQANQRDPAINATLWLVLSWGGAAAVLFYSGFGEGGFRVAALAIVPIVLLAPTALTGIRRVGAGRS